MHGHEGWTSMDQGCAPPPWRKNFLVLVCYRAFPSKHLWSVIVRWLPVLLEPSDLLSRDPHRALAASWRAPRGFCCCPAGLRPGSPSLPRPPSTEAPTGVTCSTPPCMAHLAAAAAAAAAGPSGVKREQRGESQGCTRQSTPYIYSPYCMKGACGQPLPPAVTTWGRVGGSIL